MTVREAERQVEQPHEIAEQRDADDEGRHHHRDAEEADRSTAARALPHPRQRQRRQRAGDDRNDGHGEADDEAVLQRRPEGVVGEQPSVPVEREAGQRQAGQRRLVEAEEHHQEERRHHEDDDREREERATAESATKRGRHGFSHCRSSRAEDEHGQQRRAIDGEGHGAAHRPVEAEGELRLDEIAPSSPRRRRRSAASRSRRPRSGRRT